jgi:hypothetical protein
VAEEAVGEGAAAPRPPAAEVAEEEGVAVAVEAAVQLGPLRQRRQAWLRHS